MSELEDSMTVMNRWCSVAGAVVALAGSACGDAPSLPALVVERIEPGEGLENTPTAVEVHGSGFRVALASDLDRGVITTGDLALTLGGAPLEGVVIASETVIDAVVPGTLDLGRHALEIQASDGRQVASDDAFAVWQPCEDEPDCAELALCNDTVRCVAGRCVFDGALGDGDLDGDSRAGCGRGDDCDDGDPAVHGGTPCDDGDACTERDVCHRGECSGVTTCEERCTDSCARVCGPPGRCCMETCDETGCSDCQSDCSCSQTCSGEESCQTRCQPGSTCQLAASNIPGTASLVCDQAVCFLDCADTTTCSLECNNQASCQLSCNDVATCTLLCQDGGLTSCGGGVSVCNRDCP